MKILKSSSHCLITCSDLIQYICCLTYDLQMWMNVLEALIGVIPMQHAATLKEVTPAFATLDTQAMDFIAQVSISALTTMKVATTNFVAKLHVP